MPLSVKDGMGAWVDDFKKSDAPQFKGKSEKERREMAMAAYLSAKRGDRNEATDNPPFTPDPPKPIAKNSDGTKTSPMSRARQLAKKARDAGKSKDEGYVSHAQRKAVWANRADDGKGHPDKKNESVELGEAREHEYSRAVKALKDYANKNGGIDKKDFHTAAKHLDNLGRSSLLQKGNHLAKYNSHVKGLDTDVRERIQMTLRKHGMMEGAQLDELSPATHKSYQAKAFTSGAAGMAAKRMGTMSAKDAYDNEKKRHAGIELSKSLQRRDARKNKVKLKGFGPDAAKGNMGNPSARAALKPKNEENVQELKKSTLGSYVNKASKDAASKAYGAASAAKDNRADQAGKDFAKSLQRLRGIDTATKKLAKVDTNEAKSFDQKFKDHLKFVNSKSKAVQDYMAKRKANRDARHAKQDPSAVKKNYGPAVIPPGTAYNKARKRMDPSAAANAVSNTFKNRAKGRKLPEGKIEEAVQFKVDVEGLPPTFMNGKSVGEILANLRKIIKQPSMIKSVDRVTKMDVQTAYRKKAQGREVDEAVDASDTNEAVKVNEISKDLRDRYKEKAKSDQAHQQFSADIAKEMGAKDSEKHYRKKQRNRTAGLAMVKRRENG